jgi:toxin ParE1/3/4
MALEVFWSQFAEDKLQDIFSYYKFRAGSKTASKIVDEIVDSTILLEQYPQSGVLEAFLTDRYYEFRYLISGNYKIIYYINAELNRVVIANVFDTRQNPTKLFETDL